MEGWVGLGWLIDFRHRKLNPDTFTHPSINRAWRRLTMLIEPNVLPLHQTSALPRTIFATWSLSVRLSISSCLSLCLSVCLLVALHKNYWSDVQENFTRDVSLYEEVPLNLRSDRNPDSRSTLWIRTLNPEQIRLGGGLHCLRVLLFAQCWLWNCQCKLFSLTYWLSKLSSKCQMSLHAKCPYGRWCPAAGMVSWLLQTDD